jgi:hypothetical protein
MNSQSNLPSIIGIHGHAGVGKDTVGQYLHSTRQNTWCEAFADPLKEGCSRFFGVDIECFYDQNLKSTPTNWGKTPREILQYVGTEIIRGLGADHWVKRLDYKLRNQSSEGVIYIPEEDTVVITDVRFQNEYDWITNSGGIVIHLTRPGYDGNVGLAGHSSEQSINLHNKEKTYEVVNDTNLDDLFSKVDTVVNLTGIYKQSQTSDNLF